MSSRKGRIFSEEHRKKLSLAAMGRSAWNKGKPMSEDSKRKLSLARRGQRNSPTTELQSNPNSFKNRNIKDYYSLHLWVRKNKGRATYCLLAKTLFNDCSIYFDWANISGKYKKDLNDYVPLCRKHHFRRDRPVEIV